MLSDFNSHNLRVRPSCGWGGGWVRHVVYPLFEGRGQRGPENSESGKHPQETGSGFTQPVTSIPLGLQNGRQVPRGLRAISQTVEDTMRQGREQANGSLSSSPSLRHLWSVFSERYIVGSLPQDLADSSEESWQGCKVRTQSLTFSPLLVSISFSVDCVP